MVAAARGRESALRSRAKRCQIWKDPEEESRPEVNPAAAARGELDSETRPDPARLQAGRGDGGEALPRARAEAAAEDAWIRRGGRPQATRWRGDVSSPSPSKGGGRSGAMKARRGQRQIRRDEGAARTRRHCRAATRARRLGDVLDGGDEDGQIPPGSSEEDEFQRRWIHPAPRSLEQRKPA